MNRFSTTLFYLGALLSAGGQSHAASALKTERQLEPIYTEKLPDVVTFLEFSSDGKTFILAGNHGFLYFYDATNFDKHVSMQGSRNDFRIRGVGYIDNNTWYLATDPPDNNQTTQFSIRQIEPRREIYQYDIPITVGKLDTITNENHIVHSKTMLNWRNGKTYQIELIDNNRIEYELTEDNQVVTRNNPGNLYLFNDPIKQESMIVDVGSLHGTLSPSARYALVVSDFGGCKLLQLPQKIQTGNCSKWGKDWTEAAFQRDNKIFAVSSKNKIYVYSTQPFKLLMSAKTQEEVVLLSLEDGRLAARDRSNNIKVWDIAEKKLLVEYPSHMAGTSADRVVFQPYGSKLLLTSYGLLRVFDLDSVPANAP